MLRDLIELAALSTFALAVLLASAGLNPFEAPAMIALSRIVVHIFAAGFVLSIFGTTFGSLLLK